MLHPIANYPIHKPKHPLIYNFFAAKAFFYILLSVVTFTPTPERRKDKENKTVCILCNKIKRFTTETTTIPKKAKLTNFLILNNPFRFVCVFRKNLQLHCH